MPHTEAIFYVGRGSQSVAPRPSMMGGSSAYAHHITTGTFRLTHAKPFTTCSAGRCSYPCAARPRGTGNWQVCLALPNKDADSNILLSLGLSVVWRRRRNFTVTRLFMQTRWSEPASCATCHDDYGPGAKPYGRDITRASGNESQTKAASIEDRWDQKRKKPCRTAHAQLECQIRRFGGGLDRNQQQA
jgi:hypothetical protein